MMFSTLRFTLFILAVLSLSSCAHFIKTTPEKLNTNIDHWLSHNQFDRIDRALSSINPEKKEFKKTLQRKSQIDSRKQAYIKSVIDKAQKLQRQEKWQQAIDTYIDGLRNIRDEPKFTQELSELFAERDKKIALLKKQLLIENGNALLSYNPVYQQLQNLAPEDSAAIRDIRKHQRTKRIISNHLEICGEDSYQNSELQLAHDCYTLSNKLLPSEQKVYWVNKINKQIQNQNNHQRYNQLLANYKAAYGKKAYNQAKIQLDKLLRINPQHKKAAEHLASLEAEINKLVEEKIERGKTLYSQKKINKALQVWTQAQKLSPENEKLDELITRAKKVTKKIESLEESQ